MKLLITPLTISKQVFVKTALTKRGKPKFIVKPSIPDPFNIRKSFGPYQ